MQKKDDVKAKATKAAETVKAAEVKDAVKSTAKKVEDATVKKAETAVEKAAEAKKTIRKTAAKAPKAKECVSQVVVQYDGRDAEIAKVEEKIKAKFVAEGHRAGNIKKLDIYVKPQEYKAYYVINDGKFTGDVDLF